MWNGYLDFYVKVENGNWKAWFAQHNEHRTIFSNILFYIDIHYFGGTNVFLMVTNVILMSLLALLLINIINDLFQSNKQKYYNIKLLLYFISIVMMFSWIQEENIIWGFQSQFFAAYLFPLLAFYLLMKSSLKKNNILFIASIVAGVISVGTMANGVLALPILFILSLLLRENIFKSVLILLVTSIVLYLYFHDYKSPGGHGSISDTLVHHPKDFFKYLFSYLGGIFYYLSNENKFVPQLAGIFLLLSSFLFTYLVLSRKNINKFYFVGLAFLLYYGGTAFGTAGGRALFGIDQAFSGRYMTPSLIAWSLLFILYAHYFRDKEKMIKLISIIFIVISIILIGYQKKVFQYPENEIFNKKIAALSLEMGIRDEPYIKKIFPFIDWVIDISKDPIQKNLSIFGYEDIRDVSLKMGTSINHLPKNSLIGHLDNVSIIKEDNKALRLNGWIYDSDLNSIPSQLFVVNDKKKIIGCILTGFNRIDVKIAINKKAYKSGFVGYIINTNLKDKIFLVDLKSSKKLEINIQQTKGN